jgi:fibronectin-binding autotransporter adhesin
MNRVRIALIVALGFFASLPVARAQDVITVGSQAGAQIFFNDTLTRTYNFGVTQTGAGLAISALDVNVKGGNAQANVFPVLVRVYSGLGGTGSVLASGTIAASTLTSQFDFIRVPFSPFTLATGGYSVVLSTTNTDNYYIKAGTTKLTTNGTASVTSSFWVEDTNVDGNAGTSLNAASPVLATYTLGTNAMAFGNYRVGATLSSTTPIVNTALVTSNTQTQALAVASSTSGGVSSLTGLPSPYLSVGGTANLVAALNGATTGPNSGTATLSFNSVPGTSTTTGTTAIGSGTIALSGTGWNWANAKVSSGTFAFGNVRTGSAATNQSVAIGNQAVSLSAYQDLLDVTGSTSNARVTATGFQNLASSTNGTTTSNVSLAANTASAGSLASSVALSLVSDANGVAGLSSGTATIVGVAPPTIATTGGVYDWANAAYTGTAFAFGYIHRGGAAASGTAAIGNQTVTNASYQDSLNVSASTGNPLVAASGFTGLAASAGGATTSNLVVSIGTGTAGSLNSTLALSLVSNANGVAGLSNGTAAVVGSPGAISTTGTVFTGQSTWNTNGGGEWGTLAGNFGTNWNWAAFDGSPGVDAGFTDTDTATFSGAVASGTATVTVTAAAPSIKTLTFDNASASYAVAGVSGGSLALLNAGTSSATVAVNAGSHGVSLPVSLGSNTAIDVAAGSLLSMSGVVSGAKAVTKTGAGTTVFSGSNTYGGATTVAAGRLLIHGFQTAATGAITVESGATLGGRGAAGGAVTVLSGGTLSPGASVESLVVGATTLSGTSTFFYELDSSALLSAGADLLVSNGNLTIGSGSILELTDLASSPTAFSQGTKFSLISYGTSSWNSGLFTFGGDVLANGDTFTAGLNQWQIRYDDPTGGSNFTADQLAGNSVTIMAVPEPGTLALLVAGVLAGVVATRRRPKAG